MSTASETTKIHKLIRHAQKKWKTEDREELIEKLKVERTSKFVRQFTKHKSKGKKRICKKEAIYLWKNGILKKGEGKVSSNDLHDFGYLIGSRLLTSDAKKYLIKNIIRRLGLSKNRTKHQGVKKGDEHRHLIAMYLKKFSNFKWSGFVVRHGGSRFIYRPRDYLKVGELVLNGAIDVVLHDDKSGPKGRYTSKKNLIQVRDRKNGVSLKATLIHESTHAIQDLHNLQGTKGEREIAAHVAQGVFLVLSKGDNSLGDYEKSKKTTSAEKRLGSKEFRNMVNQVIHQKGGKLQEFDEKILDGAREVLKKWGYEGKVDKQVTEDAFDKNGFIDLWLRL